MSPSIKFLTFLVLIVLILGAGWFYFSAKAPQTDIREEAVVEEETEDINGVKVTQANIAETGTSRLPAGFPKDIPVEEVNVIESYRAVYTEQNVTQYTVSYTSTKSRDALWDMYNSFMKSAGFSLDTSASFKSLGQISGSKGSDGLSIVLSARSGLTLVQVSYLDRP